MEKLDKEIEEAKKANNKVLKKLSKRKQVDHVSNMHKLS